MSTPSQTDDLGPDTHDGHDWEGFPGGCARLGCGSDCARQEIERLRAQLQPKSVRELLEHTHIKNLSAKQINDALVELSNKLRDAQAKLAVQPVALPARTEAIGAIISAHIGAKDCVPGTSNWANHIYEALAQLARANTAGADQ
jgi:hypothetical protein